MSEISVIEQTFYAVCRHWGGLNASLADTGSIRSMSSGIDSADLNVVWAEKPLEPADAETLERVKKDFRQRRLPFWFWVFPSAKAAPTIDILKAAGLSFVSSAPCMLADLQMPPEKSSINPDITIRRVENSEDLNLWRNVSFDGFDFPPATSGQYERFTGSFSLQPDCPHRLYLAFAGAKPVATSLLFLSPSAAGIYFVSTLAEYRKRGIGLALTRETMRQARTAGYRYATLQASSDGFHVYEQAGFKEYCRVDVFALA